MLTGIDLSFDTDLSPGDKENEENKNLCVLFSGDCLQDRRVLWISHALGRAMLEYIARICVETQLRQIEDRQKETTAKLKVV